MSRALALLILLSIPTLLMGQNYKKVDRWALSVPNEASYDADSLASLIESTFSRERDRLRAAYVWIVSNISYDMDRMANPASYRGDSLVNSVLRARKAICSGYADLFVRLSTRMGSNAYYIAGYTRQEGKVVDQAHAWVAVRLANGQWKFFDPTFGASEWQNGELVHRISFAYFMVEPSDFIVSHIPFDPTWQLLYQPIKAEEFYGKKIAKDKDYLFNYNDTIKSLSQQSWLDKLRLEIGRVKWSGVMNKATESYVASLNQELALELQNISWMKQQLASDSFRKRQEAYKDAVEIYRQLVELRKSYKERDVSPSQISYMAKVLDDFCTNNLSMLLSIDASLVTEKEEYELLKAKMGILKLTVAKELESITKEFEDRKK